VKSEWINNVDESKKMEGKRKRPMTKGKLIQPPRLLPMLKLSSASFEDASSLPSIVALHFVCCLKTRWCSIYRKCWFSL